MMIVRVLKSLQLPGKYAVPLAAPVAGVFNCGEIIGVDNAIGALMIADGAAVQLPEWAASQVFTESGTLNFLTGDTIVIGNQTFTIVSSIGSTPGNILVGADTNAGFVSTMSAIIASMAASISGSGATANYVPNTTPSNVSGAAGNGLTSGATYVFTALTPGLAGNSLVSTYTPAGTSAGSWAGATFVGAT